MLAESYHSELIDRIKADDFTLPVGPPHRSPRARVRLLLRRRSRRRLRVPDAPAIPGSRRLSDRRNHPQPARQREAARDGHPVPQRRPGQLERLGPDDVVILPGLRRHGRDAAAARPPRLHAHRHDLRIGAERLEERPPLRRSRVHLDHPRQGLARGDAGHRVAGRRVRRRVPGRLRPSRKPPSSATTSGTAATRGRSSRGSSTRSRRASIRTATSAASAWRTRRRC